MKPHRCVFPSPSDFDLANQNGQNILRFQSLPRLPQPVGHRRLPAPAAAHASRLPATASPLHAPTPHTIHPVFPCLSLIIQHTHLKASSSVVSSPSLLGCSCGCGAVTKPATDHSLYLQTIAVWAIVIAYSNISVWVARPNPMGWQRHWHYTCVPCVVPYYFLRR